MKITIRKWDMKDAAELAALLNNKKIQDNLRDGLPFPYCQKDAEGYILAMLSADSEKNFAFAIEADGILCGSIGAFRMSNIHFRTAELGYYVGEQFWGNGIATKAVSLVCDFVFSNTDILRIFAEPFSFNTASRKVLENNGFINEGTLRSNAFKNGKVCDMQMYSRIKTDFSKI